MRELYNHLIGIEHSPGTNDCYGLFRRFYKDVLNIDLPNYARAADFWRAGQDLITPRYTKTGFEVLDVHPSQWQFGDAIMMSIKSSVPNHLGVLVENGQLLHHFTGRLSEVEQYKGIWRHATVGVLRHKNVKLNPVMETVNILDVLPPSIRRKIDAETQDYLVSQESVRQ